MVLRLQLQEGSHESSIRQRQVRDSTWSLTREDEDQSHGSRLLKVIKQFVYEDQWYLKECRGQQCSAG